MTGTPWALAFCSTVAPAAPSGAAMISTLTCWLSMLSAIWATLVVIWLCTLPCRLLTIEAEAATRSGAAVVARGLTATITQSHRELLDESTALTEAVLRSRGAARVRYPRQGATYTLHWTTVRAGR